MPNLTSRALMTAPPAATTPLPPGLLRPADIEGKPRMVADVIGVAAANANDGWKATEDGYFGLADTVRVMVEMIRRGRNDPRMAGRVGDALLKAGRPPKVRDQVEALLKDFRRETVYSSDPSLTERVSHPAVTLCIDPNKCVRLSDCFAEGTLLLRDDFAFVPIEEIKPGDRIWGYDKWTTVSAVEFKGELPVDAIEMNNGSTMYLTKDHKVFVGRCKHGKRTECPTCQNYLRKDFSERILVSDLVEGDTLLRPDKIDFGAGAVDPGRAYIEALALADGWTSKTGDRQQYGPYSFQIAGRDGMRKEAQKHEVKAICERLGIETLWHPRYITVKDSVWAQRIHGLGSRARFKHLETINLDETAAGEAMRGLMADSTANTCGGGRTFSTTSRTLMMQLRVLQRMHGTSTGVKMLTPEEHGGVGQHPMWRVQVWGGTKKKTLAVRSIERGVRVVPCWDIATEDHYVYLAEHDVTVSNCDDRAVAMAAELAVINIPVEIVLQDTGAQPHVLLRFFDPDAGHQNRGGWTYLDPGGSLASSDPETGIPLGKAPYAKSEEFVNPFEATPKLGIEKEKPALVTFGRDAGGWRRGTVVKAYKPSSIAVGAGSEVIAVPATGYVIPESAGRGLDVTIGVGDNFRIWATPEEGFSWKATVVEGAELLQPVAGAQGPETFDFTGIAAGPRAHVRLERVDGNGNPSPSHYAFEYRVTVVAAGEGPGGGTDPTQTPQQPPPGDSGIGVGEVLLYAGGIALGGGILWAVGRRYAPKLLPRLLRRRAA